MKKQEVIIDIPLSPHEETNHARQRLDSYAKKQKDLLLTAIAKSIRGQPLAEAARPAALANFIAGLLLATTRE